MIKGETREETIRLTAEALGVSLDRAEMIVAFELGEITGDVVELVDGEQDPDDETAEGKGEGK